MAALTQWLTQRKEKRKRETLVVVTDGLLPLPEDPAQLRALTKALRRARGLTLLLLVDDPLLARQGIGRGHPLLELAAQLGARLSLRSLADYGDQAQKLDRKAVDALLRSPQVARAPQVRLPRGCTLATAVPAHLVAGQSQRIDGICEPRIKRPWAEVKLRLGTKIHKKRARASRIKPMTTHWASATSADQAQKARAAGFARPIWFSRAMLRESELTFAAAGKIQERQGYLDAELLQQRLREHLWPRAHACYNRALGRSRRQEGVAELAIALGKGEISLVQARSKSLAVKDPRFLQCLEQAAWKVRVPSALADPVVYRVYYPLKFSRPKNAEVGQISQEDRLRYEWLLGRTTGTH